MNNDKILMAYFADWLHAKGWGIGLQDGVILGLIGPYTHICYMPLILDPRSIPSQNPVAPNVPTDVNKSFYTVNNDKTNPPVGFNWGRGTNDNFVQDGVILPLTQGYQDWFYLGVAKQLELACKKLNKKFILTLGGWSDMQDTPLFSQDTNDVIANAIVQNIIALKDILDYDGFDFDWEHLSQIYYQYSSGSQADIETVVDKCLFLGRVLYLLRQNQKFKGIIVYTTRPNTFVGFASNKGQELKSASDREGVIIAYGAIWENGGKPDRKEYMKSLIDIKLGTKENSLTPEDWGNFFNIVDYVNFMAYDMAKSEYCGDGKCIAELKADDLPANGYPRTNGTSQNYGTGFTTSEAVTVLTLTGKVIGSTNSGKLIWGISPVWQAPNASCFTSLWEFTEATVYTGSGGNGAQKVCVPKITDMNSLEASSEAKNALENFVDQTKNLSGGYMFWAMNDPRMPGDTSQATETEYTNMSGFHKANVCAWMASKIAKQLNINVQNDCLSTDSFRKQTCPFDFRACNDTKCASFSVTGSFDNFSLKTDSLKTFGIGQCTGNSCSESSSLSYCNGNTCTVVQGSTCPWGQKCFNNENCDGTSCSVNPPPTCKWWQTLQNGQCVDPMCNSSMEMFTQTKTTKIIAWFFSFISILAVAFLLIFRKKFTIKPLFIGLLSFAVLSSIISLGIAVQPRAQNKTQADVKPPQPVINQFQCDPKTEKCDKISDCKGPNCFPESEEKKCGEMCALKTLKFSRCDKTTGDCKTNDTPCKNNEKDVSCWQGDTCQTICERDFYACGGDTVPRTGQLGAGAPVPQKCEKLGTICTQKPDGTWISNSGKTCYLGDNLCDGTCEVPSGDKYYQCQGESCTLVSSDECDSSNAPCFINDDKCGGGNKDGCKTADIKYSYCDGSNCNVTTEDCTNKHPGNCYFDDHCGEGCPNVQQFSCLKKQGSNDKTCSLVTDCPSDPNNCYTNDTCDNACSKEPSSTCPSGTISMLNPDTGKSECVPCDCKDISNTTMKNENNKSYCVPCTGTQPGGKKPKGGTCTNSVDCQIGICSQAICGSNAEYNRQYRCRGYGDECLNPPNFM